MYSKATSSVGLLKAFIAPYNSGSLATNPCLAQHFYGSYAEGVSMRSLYIPDAPCFASLSHDFLASSRGFDVALESQHSRSLVWLYKNDADHELAVNIPGLEQSLSNLTRILQSCPGETPDAQHPLSDGSGCKSYETPYDLLYQSDNSALLALDSHVVLQVDRALPPFWQSSLVHSTPLAVQPLAKRSTKYIKDVHAGLKFDPVVSAIVEDISVPQMQNDLRYLTGEDSTSRIASRHSLAGGSRVAATWLKERFEDTGAACELKLFREGFAPNVICRYPAIVNTTSIIMLSAHYDSRGSFGSTRAPGGDDDGSGVAALLGIARTIARNNVKFGTNVEFVAFAGEEQGLLGSRAYARELRAQNANVTLVIQADMLGYRKPGEPLQLGLPAYIGSPELAELVAHVADLYSPELTIGITFACCSDHQSFHEQGFPATQVFERAGPIADPMYHNSGDLSEREGYDLEQVKSIAKAQFATLLHVANYQTREL